jgi:hypothetical protein
MDTTPTIPYATAPARFDVSVEQDAHHVRVIVPPLPSWRMLGGGYTTVLAMLGAVIALQIGAIAQSPSSQLRGVLPAMIMWSLVLAGWIAYGVVKLHRWRIFTVTAARFAVTTRVGTGRSRTMSWPVAQVAQVKRVAASDHIMVRVIGRDWLEFAVSPDETVTSFVAETLDDALHAGLLPVPGAVSDAPQPATAVWPGTRGRPMSPAGQTAVAFAAVAVGVLCLIFPLLLLAAVVLSIPLGIWLGTRDREYYF